MKKHIHIALAILFGAGNFGITLADDNAALFDADKVIEDNSGHGTRAFSPYLERLNQTLSLMTAAEWDRPLLPDESCVLAEISVDAGRGNGLDIQRVEKHGDAIWTMLYKTSGWIQASTMLAGPALPKAPLRFQWTAVETKIDPGTQVGVGGVFQVAEENVGIEETPGFLDPRSRVKLSRLFGDPDAIEKKLAQSALLVLNLKNKAKKDDDLRIVNATPLPKAWFPWVVEAFKQRDALRKMQPEELAAVALDVKQGVLVRMLAVKFLKGKQQPCIKVIKGLLETAQQQPDMVLEFVLSQAIISAGGAQSKEVSDLCDVFVDREMKEHPQGSKALTAYAGAMQLACSYGLVTSPYIGGDVWIHGAFLDMKRSRWCADRLDAVFSGMKKMTVHRFNQEGLYLYLCAQSGGEEFGFKYSNTFDNYDDAYFAAPYQWKPKPKPENLPETPKKKIGK